MTSKLSTNAIQRFIFRAPPCSSSSCHFSFLPYSFFVSFSKRAFAFQFNSLRFFSIEMFPTIWRWIIEVVCKLHFHCFISVFDISFVLNYKCICVCIYASIEKNSKYSRENKINQGWNFQVFYYIKKLDFLNFLYRRAWFKRKAPLYCNPWISRSNSTRDKPI